MFNSEPEDELARSLHSPLAPNAVVGLGFDEGASTDPEAFRRRYSVSEPFIVFVGRLEQDKNLPLLLSYFVQYKERRPGDLTLLLVGEGDVQPPDRPDVRQLGIDWRDRDAMLRGALALVQPSRKESLSIVMMQAWLAGRPVVVDGQSAVCRYHCQRAGGGLWFDSYLEFEAIVDLLQDRPRVADGLGRAGREYVLKEYSWPVVLGRFHDALEQFGLRERAPALAADA
jgi:glycosyltransferase involved in cell wall biosynthesis